MLGLILRNRIVALAAIAAAAGVPYVAMDEDLREKMTPDWMADDSDAETELSEENIEEMGMADPEMPEHSIRNHVNTPETSLLFTPTAQDFRDVFRLDVTPNWVKSRWPRVSACVYEDGMDGLRVPLVSGTNPDDIHGSLTYYFDQQHRVQRISFSGYTGDATRLVSLLMSQFQFESKPTYSAGLYLRTYHGRPVCGLRMLSASIVRADDPHRQIQVMLEINNPQGKFQMSEYFASVLENDRLAGRWQ